jgi:hypothetical protein
VVKENSKTIGARDRRHGLTRAEVERLLSESRVEEESLGRMSSAIQAIRSVGERVPGEAETQRFAAEAARLVPAHQQRQASHVLSAHGATGHSWLRTRLRLVGAVTAVIVVLCAFSGLAYAANGAAPGDTLYGLDRALEAVGIGDGGLQERLTEAGRLVERGRTQEGLVFAADEILRVAGADEDLRSAAMVLRAAADALVGGQAASTAEDLGLIADRLRWMASSEPKSKEFGQAVLDLAVSLGAQRQNDDGADQRINTDDTGPGNSGGQGPTDSTGGVGNGGGRGSGNERGAPR